MRALYAILRVGGSKMLPPPLLYFSLDRWRHFLTENAIILEFGVNPQNRRYACQYLALAPLTKTLR